MTGKNQKDMASYKFWQTQPVPRFGQSTAIECSSDTEIDVITDDAPDKVQDGPIKVIDPNTISKDPLPMIEGFEWVTMDLTIEKEVDRPRSTRSIEYVLILT